MAEESGLSWCEGTTWHFTQGASDAMGDLGTMTGTIYDCRKPPYAFIEFLKNDSRLFSGLISEALSFYHFRVACCDIPSCESFSRELIPPLQTGPCHLSSKPLLTSSNRDGGSRPGVTYWRPLDPEKFQGCFNIIFS
jgi:hypothetical protein